MDDFSIELAVRDYECDLQGVVNHARYLHYLEHARHEYLLHCGLDFAKLTAEGVIVVVVRAEIDYRRSLRSGDRMRVSVRAVRRSRIRLDFLQTITRLQDDATVLEAMITTTAVNERGRPWFPQELSALLPSDSEASS
ncbi:MAG: acyl-CoA thioesterase [Pseudohongiellaceae bacterium]